MQGLMIRISDNASSLSVTRSRDLCIISRSRVSTELDECADFPCDPFGDCVDLVNDYKCICRPGFNAIVNDTKNCEGTNTVLKLHVTA